MNEGEFRFKIRQDMLDPSRDQAEILYFRALAMAYEEGIIDAAYLWDEAAILGSWEEQLELLRKTGSLV